MTQQYDNRGRGVLFKNDNKAEERDPDYRGNITLQDGTECWLDAWVNTSKAGKKFLSLRYKPKMAREHAGASQNPPAQKAQMPANDFDSEIPF